MIRENEIANAVIGLSIEVHNALGPGLLENAYKECLYYKLIKSGFRAEKEKPIPLIFEGVRIDCGYRVDILIEDKLVVETKSVSALNELHLAQILTYLKLGNYKLGLLINFNVSLLKYGLKRVANGI